MNSLYAYLKEMQEKAESIEREKKAALLNTPAKPGFEQLQYVIDSREQLGNRYTFGYPSIVKMLQQGDYSIAGDEFTIAVERKEINDFVNTVIRNKDRFDNELTRLTGIRKVITKRNVWFEKDLSVTPYKYKCILVESSYSSILNHYYTSQTLPQSVVGLAMSINYHYQIPIFFIEDSLLSNRFTELYLKQYYKYKYLYSDEVRATLQYKPVEGASQLSIEQTIQNLTLSQFIELVTQKKDYFKAQLNILKIFPSRAIVLQCKYSDILKHNYREKIEPVILEQIIYSIIIDYNIPIYFMESSCTAQQFITQYIKRYLPIIPKIKQPRKKKLTPLS